LVPDDFTDILACYSPGVNNFKNFEDELHHKYGIVSHMCDFTSDEEKLRTPLMGGQTFRKKWLDTNGSEDSISLEAWVDELTPNPNDELILQMDIEGAEYRNLLAVPERVLRKFRIIVIELHRLGVAKVPEKFDLELGPLLNKLAKFFTCVHAHPNNCCGEFTLPETGQNFPNVIELTLLRSDRWQFIGKEDLFAVSLPHPLDIVRNVKQKPPIVLNEFWLNGEKRNCESALKLATDELDFLGWEAAYKESYLDKVFNDLYEKSQKLAKSNISALGKSQHQETLIEVAEGKTFNLSSTVSSSSQVGKVCSQKPFFFHTAFGVNERITIDLGSEFQLFELRITNRLDTCMGRARILFYCAHDRLLPDLEESYPVWIDRAFITDPNNVSITLLGGVTGRYLSIYSPLSTALHLSSIKLFGVPCNS
jgi:hypothetical protein